MDNYKLIKPTEGYIITSDENIQPHNYYISKTKKGNTIFKCEYIQEITNYIAGSPVGYTYKDAREQKHCKKIIASTFLPELANIDFNNLEEELNIIDVEKLAKNKYQYQNGPSHSWDAMQNQLRQGFVEGFNKCLELNKDKLYTLKDIIQLFDGDYIYTIKSRSELSEYIKEQLNKANEWNVELELEFVCCEEGYYTCEHCTQIPIPKITNNSIKITKIL
jgi:hypothetical protein